MSHIVVDKRGKTTLLVRVASMSAIDTFVMHYFTLAQKGNRLICAINLVSIFQ